MKIEQVNAGAGARWFGCGWRLFRKAAGVWLVMTLILLAVTLVLGLLPLVGGIAASLLLPVFVGGFLLAARDLAREERIETGMLFAPFQEKALLNPLLLLGVLQLVLQFLLGLVFMLFAGRQLMGGMLAAGQLDPELLLSPGVVTGLLLAALLGALAAMAFLYAVPLVVLDRVQPAEALRLSFAASWKNMGALLVFGLIYIPLALVAAIPMGLGFLLLLPVSVLALYCSYEELFATG